MAPGTIVSYGGRRYLLVKPVDNRREWLVERMRDHRIMRMKVAQVRAAMADSPATQDEEPRNRGTKATASRAPAAHNKGA